MIILLNWSWRCIVLFAVNKQKDRAVSQQQPCTLRALPVLQTDSIKIAFSLRTLCHTTIMRRVVHVSQFWNFQVVNFSFASNAVLYLVTNKNCFISLALWDADPKLITWVCHILQYWDIFSSVAFLKLFPLLLFFSSCWSTSFFLDWLTRIFTSILEPYFNNWVGKTG